MELHLRELINKLKRTLNGIRFNELSERIGICTPDLCESLDGKKGSACCKLGYTCPFLKNHGDCGIYKIRSFNCKIFPARPEDLLLVKNCGYSFKKK